ncbi:MAG: hypothetical protein Q9227_000522 [Pyrenula ochraceoflavens]
MVPDDPPAPAALVEVAALGPPGGDNGREIEDPDEVVALPVFSAPDSGPEVIGEDGLGEDYMG